ncbi:helix-turn-helix transcriptional regulator [Mangrovihabitans endophyticus]|uniref:DNA-binding response regulator, NarL/FixJ family, contains REC and HTH domains n=1 Tax=Mangrovihabitans endophyticus TaxID=1751298 RepID=A0A8J3C5X0_9ACTN|nr:response regulator transcription factor family protein [Mangrovihabitans endophyticus]GGL13621.1 hypothetical protein GCM10012284_55530 [Mangrovihabitans endophyticus]
MTWAGNAVLRALTTGRRRTARRWYAWDAVLAGALVILALPRVWVTYPGAETVHWSGSWAAIILVLLQTSPIAMRRLFPLPVLVVTGAAVLAYQLVPDQPEPDYLSVCVASYTVAAEVRPGLSRWFLGATVVLVPAALAQDLTSLGIFRAVALLALVWALGLDRRRSIRDRAEAADQMARQAAREQALRSARRSLAQREGLARVLHDGLARSLTAMSVHGEALKVATGRAARQQLDNMLRAGREALTVLQATVTAFDQGVPSAAPLSWPELIAGFRDHGLAIDVAPPLLHVPLDDQHGRCLYRVVHEALTNALRYAGPGTAVRIDVELTGEATRVTVDNTAGDATEHRRSGGGFGLPSIERDVAAIGGELEFGATGDGWRVSVRLPATAPDRTQPPRLRPVPVVIVDDESMVREGIRLLLQVHPDIEVVADFADGAGLLKFLSTDRAPQETVVLLDLVMPGQSGEEVLARLRAERFATRVRVLILTAWEDEDAVRRALTGGAYGYLPKASTAAQLATAVRAVADGLVALVPGVRSGPGTADRRPLGRLTAREEDVLRLLGTGSSNREIARRLGLSERTVKIHVSAVFGKLGVRSRTQAALLAESYLADARPGGGPSSADA